MATEVPGFKLTDTSRLAGAYFACVNDNGGIHGRPIEHVVVTDGLDAQQAASAATKLLDTEKVDALVGSFSVLDCLVNEQRYRARGYAVINVGTSPECFRSPSIAPVNDGPANSALAAANYLLSQRVSAMSVLTPSTPSSDAINQGVLELARRAGVPARAWQVTVPITDPASVAQQAVQQAGDGGGVVFLFGGADATKLLTAARQQGLVDRVRWACASGCNFAEFAGQVGNVWDGKIGIDVDIAPVDSTGPDNLLFRQVRQRYAAATELNNFGQWGFLTARIAVAALLAAPPEQLQTSAGVHAALKSLKRFTSDLLCRPWYYGDQPFHNANNVTRIVTVRDGRFVVARDCTPIPAVPGNNLDEIREYEKRIGLG